MQGTSQCLAGGVDGIAYFVDKAVQTFNVSVPDRNRAFAVNPTRIRVVLSIDNAYFTIRHGVQGELLVIVGELAYGKHLAVCIFTVNQAVHHYHVADRIPETVVGESFPIGFRNNTFDAQGIQIKLNGSVGGCKTSVGTIGR